MNLTPKIIVSFFSNLTTVLNIINSMTIGCVASSCPFLQILQLSGSSKHWSKSIGGGEEEVGQYRVGHTIFDYTLGVSYPIFYRYIYTQSEKLNNYHQYYPIKYTSDHKQSKNQVIAEIYTLIGLGLHNILYRVALRPLFPVQIIVWSVGFRVGRKT